MHQARKFATLENYTKLHTLQKIYLNKVKLSQLQEAVITGICRVLWKVGEKKKVTLCLPQDKVYLHQSLEYFQDGITERAFKSFTFNLKNVFRPNFKNQGLEGYGQFEKPIDRHRGGRINMFGDASPHRTSDSLPAQRRRLRRRRGSLRPPVHQLNVLQELLFCFQGVDGNIMKIDGNARYSIREGASAPLYKMIWHWVVMGTIKDPNNEFFVMENIKYTRTKAWQCQFSLRFSKSTMGAASCKTVQNASSDEDTISSTSKKRGRFSRKSKSSQVLAKKFKNGSKLSYSDVKSLRRSEYLREEIKNYAEGRGKLSENLQSDIKEYISSLANVPDRVQEDILEYISSVTPLPANAREEIEDCIARITSGQGNLEEHSRRDTRTPEGTAEIADQSDDAFVSMSENNETAMDLTMCYQNSVETKAESLRISGDFMGSPVAVVRAATPDPIDFNDFDDSSPSHLEALEESAARILVSMGRRSYYHFFHRSFQSQCHEAEEESSVSSTGMKFEYEDFRGAAVDDGSVDRENLLQQPEQNQIVDTSTAEISKQSAGKVVQKATQTSPIKEETDNPKAKCSKVSISTATSPINRNKRKRQEKFDGNQRVLRKRQRLEPENSNATNDQTQNLEIGLGRSDGLKRRRPSVQKRNDKTKDAQPEKDDAKVKKPAPKSTRDEPKKSNENLKNTKKAAQKPRKPVQKVKKVTQSKKVDKTAKKTNLKPKPSNEKPKMPNNRLHIDQPCRRSTRKTRANFRFSNM
ncbi:unnamed protein product [Nesidiocoris tenuis]|uniref:Uncharacterized protein n=1 Tax=Nesidiocoris tenuis TaxID=355587 RepID=A0A6H5HHU7_9HEMI|nr:unnamed protein product [Nesidiocoris tenuis]